MLIENSIIKFAKSAHSNQIIQFFAQSNAPLTELQKQYLQYLLSGDTIKGLVERLFQNGWLVNFQELYKLIEKLNQFQFIANPEIQNYFAKQKNTQLTAYSKSAPAVLDSSKINLSSILQLPFFRMLPEALVLSMLQKAKLVRYPAEAAICSQGDSDRNLIVLIHGQVAIYKKNQLHRQFISVANAPSVLGESGFLTGEPRSADIITTQSCDVISIPYDSTLLDPIINQQKAHELLKRFWIQNALTSSDFFKNIPSDCLDALTFSGKIISLQNEQVLFYQNTPSDSAYLVIQGQIRIIKDHVLIANMIQGHFIGEISLTMTNGVRSATAISHGSCLLMEITRHHFYQLLSQNLFLAKEIQNLAFQRMQKDQQRKTD